MESKKVGNLTELQCATKLYELGCAVNIPFGNSEKYDLVIDWKNKLYKVQVKHGNEVLDDEGNIVAIKIKTTWTGHNTSGYQSHKYTEDDCDFFATFYNNECYLIPYDECSAEKMLRLVPPKNNQKRGISFLKDYLAINILEQL